MAWQMVLQTDYRQQQLPDERQHASRKKRCPYLTDESEVVADQNLQQHTARLGMGGLDPDLALLASMLYCCDICCPIHTAAMM